MRTGLRINPSTIILEMYCQGPKTCQEEEDQARNQNLAEYCGWTECSCVVGCCEGSAGESFLEQDTVVQW